MNINLEKLRTPSIKNIKEMVKHWDTDIWKKEMEEKTTLRIYRKYKGNINEIPWYDNTSKTNLIIKARTDTLKLNWREKYKGKETTCICGYENETLEHFILECNLYNEIRKKYLITQRPCNDNKEDILANILIFQKINKEEIKERKNLIHEIWKERKRIREAQEN